MLSFFKKQSNQSAPPVSSPKDESDGQKELLRKVRHLEIKTRVLTNQLFAGQYHSAFKGRGMSFAEVREYFSGDEVRDIDWHVTARMNHPYVKVFEEERELTMMLLIDVSSSLKFGSRTRSAQELCAEIAGTLAFSAIQNNDKVGVVLFSDKIEKFIPAKKGREHILLIIRELLTFKPEEKRTKLAPPLEFVTKVMTKRSIVCILSDFVSFDDYSKPLLIASRKHDVVSIVLNDPLTNELPDVGLMKLEDAESGHLGFIDASSKKVREHYRSEAEKNKNERDMLFRKTGIDSVTISTDGDYVAALTELFGRR